MPRTRATVLVLLLFATGAWAQSSRPQLAYQLTHVDTGEPFPSPDGTKLVFESLIAGKYQLFVMNTDGTGQRELVRFSYSLTILRHCP